MNLRQKISEAMKQFKWFLRMVVGAVTMFYLTMLAAGRLVIGICSQLLLSAKSSYIIIMIGPSSDFGSQPYFGYL